MGNATIAISKKRLARARWVATHKCNILKGSDLGKTLPQEPDFWKRMHEGFVYKELMGL